MSLDFKIDACNPRNCAALDSEDLKVSEAIYTIFPLEEDAVISWGDEDISLSYRYDVSAIIDSVLEMIFALQDNDTGNWSVVWASNTFAGEWLLTWDEYCVAIEAEWRQEFEASDYLKQHNKLKVDKEKYLSEWKKITDTVLFNLEKCGYSSENLADMELLIKANNAKPQKRQDESRVQQWENTTTQKI